MSANVQQVFRDVSPYRLVSDLGIQLTNDNDRFWFRHPKLPGVKIYLTERELITSSFDNFFVAGDIFDFLAMHLGGYLLAVQHIEDNYGNFIPPETPVSQVAGELESARRRFMNWLALRSNFASKSPAFAQAFGWLRQHGTDLASVTNVIYAATGKALNKIMVEETAAGTSSELDPNSIYVVLPYFSDYHTISEIRIKNVNDPKFDKRIVLHPSRYSYFGLHTMTPDMTSCRVFRDAYTTMAHHAFVSETGQSKFGCLHVNYDADQYHDSLQFHSGIFILTPDTLVSDIVRIRTAFDHLDVAEHGRSLVNRDDIEVRPWKMFLIDSFMALLGQNRKITAPILLFVETLKLDPSTLEWFMEFLGSKLPDIKTQLDRAMSVKETSVFNGIQIIDTPSGLFARRMRHGDGVRFTNFTIRFDRNIWFEATREIFHSGQVLFNQKSYPVQISHASLSRPSDIEKIACTAVLPGLREGDQGTPAILDITFKTKLSAHLIKKSSNASRISGVDFLGWDRMRGRFTAPTWQVDAYGTKPTSGAGHPGIEHFLRHYTFRRIAFVEATSKIDSAIRYFVALMLSALARSFLNISNPTIPILRSNSSACLVNALFVPFGQNRSIDINPNARYDIHKGLDKCSRGYPAFGQGRSPRDDAGDMFHFPFFYLGDKGLTYNDDIDNESYQQIYSLVYRTVTKCIAGMIRSPRKVRELIFLEDPKLDDRVIEGNKIYSEFYDPKAPAFATTDLPLFHQILVDTEFSQLHKHFEFDLSSQTILINTRKFDDIRRSSLADELKQRNSEVSLSGRYHIAAPVAFLSEIMEKFYGQPIRLPNREEPVESTEAVSEPKDALAH